MLLQLQHLFTSQLSTLCTGDVRMSNDPSSAGEEDRLSSQQAPAKRRRHVGVAEPHDLRQDAAVDAMHAAHAEPAGSVEQMSQMSQPAAVVRRCVCLHENTNYALLVQQRL